MIMSCRKGLISTLLLMFATVLNAFGNHFTLQPDSVETIRDPLGQISYQPQVIISPLPAEVEETSGLIYWNDLIWTHNDSGGEPVIYGLSPEDGSIEKSITVKDLRNNDWEDITQDENYIFIGDFGNNSGMRKNLSILRISKAGIQQDVALQEADAVEIRFSYADQHDFSRKTYNHNFDCEAMISYGDSLYLFSKNWADNQTKLYALPKIPGEYQPAPQLTFEADGLITGADLSPDTHELVLIGYRDYVSFMWLLTDFEGANFFGGTLLRIDFPELVFVQTEGICFTSAEHVVFSCEESAEAQSLFQVDADELRAVAVNRLGSYASTGIRVSGMPLTVDQKLELDILEVPAETFTVEIRDKRWNKLFGREYLWADIREKFRLSVATNELEPGLYFFRILSGDQKLVKKIEVKH